MSLAFFFPRNDPVIDKDGRMTVPWVQYLQQLGDSVPPGTSFVIAGFPSSITIFIGPLADRPVSALGNLYFSTDTGEIFIGTDTGWVTSDPPLTGDVTKPGGSDVTTLATVNSDPGTFGSGSSVPQLVVNAKGLVTSVVNIPISGGAPAGTNGSVQYNVAGAFTADSVFSYAQGLHRLYVPSIDLSAELLVSADAGSATKVLHGGSVPSWSAVSLSADVSGTLPINHGGTGQVTASAAFGALSPLTTKGDVLGFSTLNARIPVGTNGQVLTADSAQTLGLKWATPAAGTVTSVDASGGTTGLTFSGGPITNSGTLTLAGTLGIANGGTNLTSYTTGDTLYASATNVLSKRTIGSTGQVLTVAGGIPTWAAPATSGTVTSVALTVPTFLSISGSPITSSGTLAITLSGTALPVANGGTSLTTLTANNVILGNGSSAPTFVAPGTSGNVLTSNGTTWTSAAPAGGSSYALQPVRVSTTANGTLATAFANGQTIDGVVLATGNRILLKNQSTASQNGIYVVAASGAPTRATDFTTAASTLIGGISVSVQEGTRNAGSTFICTNIGTITIGSTSITWNYLNGTAQYSLQTALAPRVTTDYALAWGDSAEATGTLYPLAIGAFSIASGNYSICLGYGAQHSGSGGIRIGSQGGGLSSGTNSIAIGAPSINKDNSILLGATGFANPMGDFAGQVLLATGYWSATSALADYVIGVTLISGWTQTTNGTPVELGISGDGVDVPTARIVLHNDCAYIFDCDIIGKDTTNAATLESWNVKFTCIRDATAASTQVLGVLKTVLASAGTVTGWDVNVTADTSNGRPAIKVTGAAATTIRWVANIKMTKVAN